jgi:hypothetical protein
VVVVELRQHVLVERRPPAARLDDEQQRIVIDRQPISPILVGGDDLPPIRDADSGQALFPRIELPIRICIVEHHPRSRHRPRIPTANRDTTPPATSIKTAAAATNSFFMESRAQVGEISVGL